MIRNLSIIFWNVCGLGRHKKFIVVKIYSSSSYWDLCLLETKLKEISHFKALSFLPPNLTNFRVIPTISASDGIATAWDDDLLLCSKVLRLRDTYALTCLFESRVDSLAFCDQECVPSVRCQRQ